MHNAFKLLILHRISKTNIKMKRLIKSFGFAIRGIKIVFGTEANMKIHLAITIIVILAGITLSISVIEWVFCILCFGIVIGSEMINTSIENIVDLVSPNPHPLAGKAKDIAAGAVLIVAICSIIIGLIIFLPKLWSIYYI